MSQAAPPDVPESDPAFPRPSRRTVIHATIGLSVAIAIIIFGMPFFADTTWSQIAQHLTNVGPLHALELFLIMVFGLWCYTFTLTGSLPGLTHGRALMMNVSGSAVGNLMPGGGAAGVAVTYLFGRSWGFSRMAISTSIIVSGVWNVLARVALPLLGIAVLAWDQTALPKTVRQGAFGAATLALITLAIFIAMVISDEWAGKLGTFLDKHVGHVIAKFRRGAKKGKRVDLASVLQNQRSRLAAVTARGWLPMTFGVVGLLGVHFLLFWRTMEVVGVTMPVPQLFAAYAIGRLLTAVGVTPGGLGITEAGTLSVMVAWGAEPAAAAAGVLIFALFTHIFEVPLGALGWLGWTLSVKKNPPD